MASLRSPDQTLEITGSHTSPPICGAPAASGAFWWSTRCLRGGCGGVGSWGFWQESRGCFHFVSGVLLGSAAVAVNWKCQTCRLAVASRACVINWTSHGTPSEGSCPSAPSETSARLPTTDNDFDYKREENTKLDFTTWLYSCWKAAVSPSSRGNVTVWVFFRLQVRCACRCASAHQSNKSR